MAIEDAVVVGRALEGGDASWVYGYDAWGITLA